MASGAAPINEWGRDQLGVTSSLVDDAMPNEKLSPDELLACCWDDPGAVLGLDDGSGCVSVVVRRHDGDVTGFVRLLAVHPGARRQGFGTALLRAGESWLRDHGARTIRLAAAEPFFLWPGVDVRSMLPMLCLAEAAGYSADGATVAMSMSVTFRATPPEGLTVRRVLDDADVRPVCDLVRFEWPEHLPVVQRAVEHGSCLAAFDEGAEGVRAVGVAAHSVNRSGWLDTIGTSSSRRRIGVGAALLGQVCTDLMVASFRDVEIVAGAPTGFYARAGGAVSRVYRTMTLSS